jgi:hypothetical protein
VEVSAESRVDRTLARGGGGEPGSASRRVGTGAEVGENGIDLSLESFHSGVVTAMVFRIVLKFVDGGSLNGDGQEISLLGEKESHRSAIRGWTDSKVKGRKKTGLTIPGP